MKALLELVASAGPTPYLTLGLFAVVLVAAAIQIYRPARPVHRAPA
jgi:hypothetical protein